MTTFVNSEEECLEQSELIKKQKQGEMWFKISAWQQRTV
jgi:hypothetical protein